MMDMKKLSLKLLGDSGIKTLCKSYLFVGLLMAFCLAACSDDDDDTVVPVFPEKQNLICNAGRNKGVYFLRRMPIGVWLLLLFGVNYKRMIRKSLFCPELQAHIP